MSKTYTAVQGDMWDSIAYSKMGSVAYTDKLMRANQEHAGYYILHHAVHEALSAVVDLYGQ